MRNLLTIALLLLATIAYSQHDGYIVYYGSAGGGKLRSYDIADLPVDATAIHSPRHEGTAWHRDCTPSRGQAIANQGEWILKGSNAVATGEPIDIAIAGGNLKWGGTMKWVGGSENTTTIADRSPEVQSLKDRIKKLVNEYNFIIERNLAKNSQSDIVNDSLPPSVSHHIDHTSEECLFLNDTPVAVGWVGN